MRRPSLSATHARASRRNSNRGRSRVTASVLGAVVSSGNPGARCDLPSCFGPRCAATMRYVSTTRRREACRSDVIANHARIVVPAERGVGSEQHHRPVTNTSRIAPNPPGRPPSFGTDDPRSVDNSRSVTIHHQRRAAADRCGRREACGAGRNASDRRRGALSRWRPSRASVSAVPAPPRRAAVSANFRSARRSTTVEC